MNAGSQSDTPQVPLQSDSARGEEPGPVPVARPVWSDHARFLLLDAPKSRVWVDVGVFLICLLAFEAVFSTVILATSGFAQVLIGEGGAMTEDATDEAASAFSHALLVPTLLIRASFAIFLIALILRVRGQRPGTVGLTREAWGRNTLIGIGATPAVYGLIYLCFAAVWLIQPDLMDQMTENAGRIIALVPKMSPLSFAGISLVVGVYEELIFRGFLLTRLRRGTGSWTLAVLLSTAIFTALHAVDQTPVALIAVTVLGLSFCLLTIWRRSIVPAIVVHALFDFSQFLGLYVTQGDAWN